MPHRTQTLLIWSAAVLAVAGLALLAGCDQDDDATAPATTGRIRVLVEPDTLAALWDLSGPAGYARAGTSSALVPDLAPGPYALAWRPVDGWQSPDPDTLRQVLTAGETAVFDGRYTSELPPLPGRVVIAVVPDTLTAGWQLTGPGGGSWSGTGSETIRDLAAGEYTVAWQDLEGWATPDPHTATGTLAEGSTLVLTGEYLPGPLYPRWERIPAGTFTMGAPVGEPGSRDNEYPQHQVTLTRAFWIQNVEVTNAQYVELANWAIARGYATADDAALRDALDGSTAQLLDLDDDWSEIEHRGGQVHLRDAGFGTNPEHPVKEVSWYGAAAYCDWLSLREGRERAYDHADWSCHGGDPYGATGYRLPTEAEWEYACRAGSTTAFANGPITMPDGAPDPVMDAIGWYRYNSTDWTHPVALKVPNAWGLYDMHGNLLKWCQGWWDNYTADPVTDPVGGTSPRYRVTRGGSWSRGAWFSRSAMREQQPLDFDSPKAGFRPVRTATAN